MVEWSEIRTLSENPLRTIPEGTELISVVGVSFVPEYPRNILSLANRQEDIFVGLKRNPDNPYDKNAIEVRYGDQMLGHIPKDIAARMAPRMDAGNQFLGKIWSVRISPENPNNPGLDILVGEWS